MPEFIAEQYFSRTDADAARRAAITARSAAEQLAREGTDVELVRSVFVPEDETCIFIYNADSLDSVRLAAQRGAPEFEHVAPGVTDVKGRPAASADYQGIGKNRTYRRWPAPGVREKIVEGSTMHSRPVPSIIALR